MTPFTQPVYLKESSMRITILHKTLKTLGFEVSAEEVKSHTAGDSTLKQVRAFQAKLDLKFDDKYVVDQSTYGALVNEILKGSHSDKSGIFKVNGTVYNLNAEVVKQQKLIAFDADLRGVAIYRSVKSSMEIEANGGFEFVGEANSDTKGNYLIEFYNYQFADKERKKADIIVYAVNEKGEILGRSRLINSEEYSDLGEVRNLDVVITTSEDRTEYDLLMDKLLLFLKENDVRLLELAQSGDQVKFLSDELDEEETKIQIAVDAESLREGEKQKLTHELLYGIGRQNISAESLQEDEKQKLIHELLYGIGRQNISLDWLTIYRKTEDELKTAIEKSVNEKIISGYDEKDIFTFLSIINNGSMAFLLQYKDDDQAVSLEKILSAALPEKDQQLAFMNASRSFKSQIGKEEIVDYGKFWDEYLPQVKEFKENPQLISNLLFNQQLAIFTGDHHSLVEEIQVNRKVSSLTQLVELEMDAWKEIISKTGVPEFVDGENESEKISNYANQLQASLYATYPTQKITLMLKKQELKVKDDNVSGGIGNFLSNNEQFDFSSSHIHDFENQIKDAAPEHFENVKSELKRMQRVFQVSPAPAAMGVLMENNLNSAYSISGIPKKSFIKIYGDALGGTQMAEAVYQRAEHVSTMASERSMIIHNIINDKVPAFVQSSGEYNAIMSVLEKKLPDYSNLFGSPDICECDQCRSVYSAAAYFVELLRFLWRGGKNADNFSPLEMFAKRRPDLLHLPLTCENTNTIIPYIDLVNEVMEYYTFNGQLNNNAAYDTGDTTADELRANPQNSEPEAYRILKDAVYPFSLPYHQPLDVIRTYSDHLKIARFDVMKGLQNDFSPKATLAIESEVIKVSEEEFIILTGGAFDGIQDTRKLNEYFGYAANADPEIEAKDLEKLAAVPEFLKRSGIKYTDLIELIKTKFINPHQDKLDFVQAIFSDSAMNASTIYTKLQQIHSGTLDPAADTDIMPVLSGASIPAADFTSWVQKNFDDFNSAITLYQLESKCDLKTTYLKTVQKIYSGEITSGITDVTWSKMHRFIRLWRKLGWNIHEVDLMLLALGESDITATTISKLSNAVLLNKQLKLPVNKLAALWGSIDTYGEKSLYKTLFLNKAVQKIDIAFEAGKFGKYLNDSTVILKVHIPALLAAFRISEEDLNAILSVAHITDATVSRPIDPALDKLNIYTLSVIYRYTILSKALQLKVSDFCLLTKLFSTNPFSDLSINNPAAPPADSYFTKISPAETFSFYQLAISIKKSGFKPEPLQYIFSGKTPAESTLSLNDDKVKQTAKAIRETLAIIEQDHPAIPASPLTSEVLKSKLSLTFKPEVADQLIGIAESQQKFSIVTDVALSITIPGTLATKYTYDPANGKLISSGIMTEAEKSELKALENTNENFKTVVDSLYETIVTGINTNITFSVITDKNLAVSIPGSLTLKYSYTKASGRLTCKGIMSDSEKAVLTNLADANTNFKTAVEALYQRPAEFIKTNYGNVFPDMTAALIILLDHPAQPVASTLEQKLQLIYTNYLPLLKQKLREDAVTRNIAELIGLSEETTTILLKSDLESIINSIVKQGFSAEYFSDELFSTSALKRTDDQINFEKNAPATDRVIPEDVLSVRWQSFLSSPSSGEHIFIVNVSEEDTAFKLYLDGVMLLEKRSADAVTSYEVSASLNAAQLHNLVVEYVKKPGKAGITLSWKTAITATEIIPSASAYPSDSIAAFFTNSKIYHRAAKFISGFALTDKEISHFLKFNIDFDNIYFKALTPGNWIRINNYVRLRNAVPQSQALLTDVFAASNIANPAPTIASLTALLNLATGWDFNTITYLINNYYALTTAQFKNEVELLKIYYAVSFCLKTGLSAQILAQWAIPETDFDKLNSTADLVKSTVKAKYEEEDWIELAGDLSDKIRENQKQALINYLLTKQELMDWGVADADGLFEYFLIDVQMGACMDTSRIVQANAAVQMFVNRCLLNLESDKTSGKENGVAPDAIDKERWEGMKYYRVWEVNRKVLFYPENWLEPEWRDDRSSFFKELESELTQNDITDRSVETAFRNYLTKLNTVANLDVCGMYQENYEADKKMKLLHVFGRTHNAPYQFFYRTCNEFWKWNAWEKVQVDIRMTEDGENSGVHLAPVVWKNRLFIFWLEFIEKTEESKKNMEKTAQQASEEPLGKLQAKKYLETRLAWSEYIDGKWSSKQLTKEFLKFKSMSSGEQNSLILTSGITNNVLSLSVRKYGTKKTMTKRNLSVDRHISSIDTSEFVGVVDSGGVFKFTDIQSKVEVSNLPPFPISHSSYSFNYEKHKTDLASILGSSKDTYLQKPIHHKIISSNASIKIKIQDNPFFYQDANHTYFVKPNNVLASAHGSVRIPAGDDIKKLSPNDDRYIPESNKPTDVY